MSAMVITPEMRREIEEIVDARLKDMSIDREQFHALAADVSELKLIVRELAEAQTRTEQRVEELAEAQKRTEAKIRELAEAQKRTEQSLKELVEAQIRLDHRLAWMDREWGLTLEEISDELVPLWLEEKHGIEVDRLRFETLLVEGRPEEFDLVGYGWKGNKRVFLVG